MKNRIISFVGAVALVTLAAVVYVFDHIGKAAYFIADYVAGLGLDLSDAIVHKLVLCPVCNLMEHIEQAALAEIQKGQQATTTKYDGPTNGPQATAGKPQVIVSQPSKFVS